MHNPVLTCATLLGTRPLHCSIKTRLLFQREYFTLLTVLKTFTYQFTMLCDYCILTPALHQCFQIAYNTSPPVLAAAIRRTILKMLLHASTTLSLHLGPQSRVKNCRILLPKHSCYITLQKRKERDVLYIDRNESINSWVKRDQLDATCFIITLFSAQHVSDVNTSILRSLRLICKVTSWVVSGSMCVGVPLQCGYGGVVFVCSLKHCSAVCWALNKVIIKQVASSWSLFTQLLDKYLL